MAEAAHIQLLRPDESLSNTDICTIKNTDTTGPISTDSARASMDHNRKQKETNNVQCVLDEYTSTHDGYDENVLSTVSMGISRSISYNPNDPNAHNSLMASEKSTANTANTCSSCSLNTSRRSMLYVSPNMHPSQQFCFGLQRYQSPFSFPFLCCINFVSISCKVTLCISFLCHHSCIQYYFILSIDLYWVILRLVFLVFLEGIYRSAFPTEKNFAFLQKLQLKWVARTLNSFVCSHCNN